MLYSDKNSSSKNHVRYQGSNSKSSCFFLFQCYIFSVIARAETKGKNYFPANTPLVYQHEEVTQCSANEVDNRAAFVDR